MAGFRLWRSTLILVLLTASDDRAVPGALAIALPAFSLLLAWSVHRNLRKMYPPGSESTASPSEAGLVVEGPFGRSEHPWKTFREVAVLEKVVGLRLRSVPTYITIPRGALTAEELEVVRANISA